MPFVRPYVLTGLIGLAAAFLFAAQANAQQVYRIVGPDGKVTFSDKPPVDANAKLAPVVALPGGGGSSGAALPFELRQVASRYPVTLYTSNDCGPCGAGRAYLSSRGIPFAEKTVTTAEDAEALQRMAGVSSLPLLTIGGQQIKGYSDSEWGQFLDAAGYPTRSALPASWRNLAPSPLVAVQRPVAPAPTAAAEASTPRPAPAPAPVQSGDNPAGIKF
jgi:glutaredoxin